MSGGRWAAAAAASIALAAGLPGSAAALAPPVEHRTLTAAAGAPATATLGTAGRAGAVAVRARAGHCAHRRSVKVVVRVDGQRAGHALLHGPRWRALSFTTPIASGDHRVRLSASGARGCSRVILDELRLAARRAVPLNTAATAELALGGDERARETFRTAFDGLTPENEMKMEVVQPRRGAFHFARADALVDHALALGKTIRGHTLIWHNQLPSWVTGHPWSRAAMLTVMHEWIGAIAGRYRGKVVAWDVLNEVFDDHGQWRTSSPWYRALGSDLAEAALRAAHEADPGARLFINDYDIERPGPKQDAVYDLVRSLRARGVPLHGVGIQGHWTVGDVVAEDVLRATMRRFASLGVRVEITELDVMTDDRPDAAIRQAAAYAMAGRVCDAVPACDRITVWGISDRDSWRGVTKGALLFDTDFLLKPAYTALQDALSM